MKTLTAIHKKLIKPICMHDLHLFANMDGQRDTDSAEGAFYVPLSNESTGEHHRGDKLTIVVKDKVFTSKGRFWPPLIPTSRSSQF